VPIALPSGHNGFKPTLTFTPSGGSILLGGAAGAPPILLPPTSSVRGEATPAPGFQSWAKA
jgi:hypothetical protein